MSAKPIASVARISGGRPAEPPEVAAMRASLTYSKQGAPHATIANAVTILSAQWPPGTVVFDRFANEIQSTARPRWDAVDVPREWYPGPWTSLDDVRTSAWLARAWAFRAGLDVVHNAVDIVAHKATTHPIVDYFDGLTWDNVPRVDSLLSRYFGAAPTPYAADVGRMLMVGAVARVEDPGCKLDTMPVLEGPQGIGKSSGIKALFGAEWFSDTPLDLSSKDRFVALRGKWAIEIAELDGFDRHETTRIKAFVSSPVDTYRPPYARCDERIDRQCVFIGTTNADGYLRDVTGNRRFFPERCGSVDLEAIHRDRDQLWAEATTLHVRGVPWWPEGDMVATFAAEQAKRVQVDAWEERIEAFVENKSFVTVADVLQRLFDMQPEKWPQADQNRVSRALVKLGWQRSQKRIEGRQTWGYVTTGHEVVT